MSVIVRVLFLLVVSSVSVIQSAPIDCHICKDLNSRSASVKITAPIKILDKVCCRQ